MEEYHSPRVYVAPMTVDTISTLNPGDLVVPWLHKSYLAFTSIALIKALRDCYHMTWMVINASSVSGLTVLQRSKVTRKCIIERLALNDVVRVSGRSPCYAMIVVTW